MLTGRIDTKASKASLMVVALVAGLLLAGGTAFAAAGDLDRTFSKNGRVITELGGYDSVSDLVVQPDGKIVAAGYSSNNGPGPNTALVRYNRNGMLDKTFGDGDGKVAPDFGGGANAVALQPDGKIVAAGGARGFALARYNPDGSPDETFGENGTVKTDGITYNNNDGASDLVVQPDGEIVVAGKLFDKFALARYNPDGSPDETFGEDGVVTTGFGGEPGGDSANALALQSDGRIVATGSRDAGGDGDSVLTRYNRNGTLDRSFGGDGKMITGGRGFTSALVVQSNGKPVVAGSSGGDNFRDDFLLERYNPDGTLDTRFGGDGRVTTNFGGYDRGTDLALQPDGKLVAAGRAIVGENPSVFALARYNQNGTLDRNFGGDGRVTTNFGNENENFANALTVQPDGRLVAAGGTFFRASDSDFALARFTAE